MEQNNTTTLHHSEDLDEGQLYKTLDEIIAKHKDSPGALIPILQEAENLFGYLPKPALRKISMELNKPFSEVAGVVGFYSYFSTVPKGKYTARVCLGTACYVRGANDVLKAVEHELEIKVGETTTDRKFSLEVGRCFGACGLAPVMMINDQTIQNVKPSKIGEIFKNIE
jgi:NADH:ubiquinone oxidoreductase subunit E